MVKRNKKPRPPRLYTDDKGRYIKLNGKKVYIKSTMSNKQLVKVVVNNFQKRKRRQKYKKKQIKKEVEDLEKINKSQANDLSKVMFFLAANQKDKEERDRRLQQGNQGANPPANPPATPANQGIHQQIRQLIKEL